MSAIGQPSPLALPESNATLEERLIEQARAMIPTLRSRERAAIEAGQVPREAVESLTEAGLFKVLQPSRHWRRLEAYRAEIAQRPHVVAALQSEA